MPRTDVLWFCCALAWIVPITTMVASDEPAAQQTRSDAVAGARSFIETLGADAVSILDQSTQFSDDRDRRLRDLLDNGLSFRAMGKAILGHHWTQATEEQRTRFAKAFGRYLLNYCIGLLDKHEPDRFRIVDASSSDTKGSVIVTSVRRRGFELTRIEWVVHSTERQHQVVDLVIDGFSLSRTYRSEFSAVAKRVGIDGLIAALNEKVDRYRQSLRAGRGR